jgi:enoyl-CoA hydratase/carnithine racemase
VSENSILNFKKVQSMMRTGTTITSQQALGYGIVKEIVHNEIPAGTVAEEIIFIN